MGGTTSTAKLQRAAPGGGAARLRLAIVGDVHGCWLQDAERAALQLLQLQLCVLVGDIGDGDEEGAALVQQIAGLDLPKAVVLGNHDAWGSQVRPQLEALGSDHVGYATRPLGKGFTLMGVRPFSEGGESLYGYDQILQQVYGIRSMRDSADRIVQVASSAPPGDVLLVVGHNGPTGLGARPYDLCGMDFVAAGGDHGDPDLEDALSRIRAGGRRVALVAFGHMHHRLHPRQQARGAREEGAPLRRMVLYDSTTGTTYVNAAVVPRMRRVGGDPLTTRHHFIVVELEDGEVVWVKDVWVQAVRVQDRAEAAEALRELEAEAAAEAGAGREVVGEPGEGLKGSGVLQVGDVVVRVCEERTVLSTVAAGAGEGQEKVLKRVWNANQGVYEEVEVKLQTPMPA